MKGTDPNRQVSRQEERQWQRRMLLRGPPLKLKVIGDGFVHKYGRPTVVPDKLFHMEWWTAPDKNGVCHNKVPRRKSMRKFPELAPISSTP